ncbi:MAG TPA: hypothetical protein VFV05_24510 [Methylomirabilota bacterium]|nr:hypothetical protein [Methylomirabilota bacterium]
MLTIDLLRRALGGRGEDRALTLDPAFQGLPETAHGGSVLAAFDAVSGRHGPRELHGHYLKRVPLGVPLRLRVRVREAGGACELELSHDDGILVTGRVAGAGVAEAPAAGGGPPPPAGAPALPVSRACFACGVDNPLGLGVRLRADDVAVGGTWTPRPGFRQADGTLAAVAVTALLDETAFWLGALATGESGMTTQLRVTLYGAAPADGTITVAGARGSARPRADARYWDTEVTARDGAGRLLAGATITFVAIRGAARRLVTGMLAVNAPDVVRRVFPAYAPPA